MASRIKIMAKLGLLVGFPLAIVGTIFGAGVHCGVEHQRGVLTFERDVLSMDVEVPAETDEAAADEEKDGGEPKTETKKRAPEREDPVPVEKQPPSAEKTPPEPETREPAPVPEPVVEPAAAPSPDRFPIAIPEPLEDEELSKRLASLRTLEVKVFVDPEIVSARSDWIDYASRLVRAASGSYANSFGIQLRLVGVVEWDVATAALGRTQMTQDLAARPGEGADLLVGLTAQASEADRGAATVAEGDENGAFAVVYADAGEEAPHLRPLLRELGHMFGAPRVSDAQSDAYQRGSWMSLAPVPKGATPWIDAASRRRILERKDRPFPETK